MVSCFKFSVVFLLVTVLEFSLSSKTTFCCDRELETADVYRLVKKQVKHVVPTEKEVIIGYKECGVIGQKQCPIYDYVWEDVVYYSLDDVKEKTQKTLACPDEHVVCCDGYVRFRDNCYRQDEIDDLKKLEELGILG